MAMLYNQMVQYVILSGIWHGLTCEADHQGARELVLVIVHL